MSPIVSERIWALPISGAMVKFLQYLVFRSDHGGEIPVNQRTMAQEYNITPQAVSKHVASLCDLNIVLRPQNEVRRGNSYRLHPLAAKYGSHEDMVAAFEHAVTAIKRGDLPNLDLPSYRTAPPTQQGQPDLRVA